jgi:hypothetical protein
MLHHCAIAQVGGISIWKSKTEKSLWTRLTFACLLLFLVVKNPDEECNPFIGDDDVLGIVIGVALTVIALGYAGWSATADKTLSGNR